VLQHVSLEVRADQVEDCVRFWAHVGFERMTRPPSFPDNSVWVERQGTQIHLLKVDAPSIPREGHAAVLVADYPGALAALERAGFEPSPGMEGWGAPRSFVRDPAGHLVEIMSAPPMPPWPEAAAEDAEPSETATADSRPGP
jgi:catechol 2,3-dioxygenase-like lactoylglutathione lyase family enzyme